jgi:hypothetical protein
MNDQQSPKSRYASPSLQRLGSIGSLTAGGSVMMAEGTSAMAMMNINMRT